MSITVAEWQAAFEAAQSHRCNDDGMTSREIRKACGWGDDRVNDMLVGLIEAGKVVVGRAYRTNICGVLAPVPVYRLKPEA